MQRLIRPALIALLGLAAAGVWLGATPVEATGVTAIAAGGDHTCALSAAGDLKCWGANGAGQLGDGTTTQRTTPVDVLGLSTGVASVAAGYGHTCAVTMTGGTKCWGANSYSQLGDGTTVPRTAPTDVFGLTSGVAAIATGQLHTCAVTAGGGVKCWGANDYGWLGDGTTTYYRSMPLDVCATGAAPPCSASNNNILAGITAVAAGNAHTCALTTSGGVKCWGWNRYGQLGDGTQTSRTTPVDVLGLSSGVRAIAAGGHHTCAVTTAGGVKCWGDNEYSELGIGTSDFNAHPTPTDVALLSSGVQDLAAGAAGYHTCALTTTAGLKCWGWNAYSQLGDGTLKDRSIPVGVAGLTSGVTAVAAGGRHTCALTTTGGLKCWGFNGSGQLGVKANTDACYPLCSKPVDVVGLSQPPDTDTDGDGCTNAQEVGSDPKSGGLRNPKDFWDFFDTPTPPSFARDRSVTIGDIAAVVMRFGSFGDAAIDPLSAPAPPPAFHTGYDRTPAGPESWKTAPPDGSITIGDITLAVAQFGHTCA